MTSCPWSFSARRRRFTSPNPPSPLSGLVDASAVVAHLEDARTTLDTEIHAHLGCLGMAPHVGQRLSHGGQQVLGDLVGDGGVHRTVERRADLEPDHRLRSRTRARTVARTP